MTTIVNSHKTETKDYKPVRCIVEMTEDSQIAVIVERGCSVPDVHDMLHMLTLCGGHLDHLTLIDGADSA